MVIGKFGTKTFEVSQKKILTFGDFSIAGELEVSSEEAAKKKPATTVKGPGLLKVSMEVQLLASAGIHVQTEIDDWMAIKDAGQAYPFILCGRAVSLNSFLLTSCSVSDIVISKIAASPLITSGRLKLEFQEYLPPGTGGGTKKQQAKSAAGNTPANMSISDPYKVPSTDQKAAAKRIVKG